MNAMIFTFPGPTARHSRYVRPDAHGSMCGSMRLSDRHTLGFPGAPGHASGRQRISENAAKRDYSRRL